MIRSRFPSVGEKTSLMGQCYNRTNKQPALGFFVGSEYPNERYTCYADLPSDRPLVPADFPIEPFLQDCERLYQEHAACGGDLFWTGTPFWGIPWIEAMLGCEIWFNPESHSIASRPIDPDAGPDAILSFSAHNAWVELLLNFFRALSQHSNGRYPIGTTRIRGLADILAAILGGEDFVVRAATDPLSVIQLLEKITPFYSQLMEMQISAIPLFHGGMGSFYYYNWVPANTRWHQEDSVMLLSPGLYKDIIEPFDRQIFSTGNNICHFHSVGGYIPYKEILAFRPLAVEMHLDTGGPSAQELFAVHKEILATSPLIIWGKFSEADFSWIFGNLDPHGLILSSCVDGAAEAGEIWERWM